MVLYPFGAEVFDVTVPFGLDISTWPAHPPAVVEPPRRIAHGDGAPARVPLVCRS